MLVAEVNHFPIGQVWIDLVKKHQDSISLVWALRVMPCLQNLGIGSRLISTAERAIQSCGLTVAEIAVEKDNPTAKRLYERLGYRVIVENTDEWNFTKPDGKTMHIVSQVWLMQKELAGL